MLELRNVTKKFGNTTAVNDVNFTAEGGELLALLGPSGCGKTTTLRSVAGLEEPDEGSIYSDGKDMTDLTPQERDIAMVFQSYALYTHMKVDENIGYPLKIEGMAEGERGEKVHDMANLLEIEHLLDKKPSTLSGGEQQRVALARALIREPNLFLLDEPLSNVDAKRRVRMRADLKNLQEKMGITTLYVTHDTEEAMAIGDRIAVMKEGQIEQVGTPEEIFDEPATKFVGGFIGTPSMNFFDGEMVKKDGGCLFEFKDFGISPPSEKLEGISTPSDITIGIRPKDLEIMGRGGKATIPAEVYAVEPQGSGSLVSLKVKDDVYKVKTEERVNLDINEQVFLKFNVDKAHFFDSRGKKVKVS